MDLQEHILQNTDYIQDFKDQGLRVRKYKKLIIVKYPYDNPPDPSDESFSWKRYCRGAVIDTETNTIICLPPPKATEIESHTEIPEIPDSFVYNESEISDDTEYQVLIDGTMINLFYHDGEWLISTRSEIGGYNKWLPGEDSKKTSFKDMFYECLGKDMLSELNPEHSYSFVMRHKDNRNVSPIHQNEAYLIDIYSYDTSIRRLSRSEYPEIKLLLNESITDSKVFTQHHENDQPLPYHCKGYTTTRGTYRYNKINPLFTYVQEMKGQTNNPFLNYISLRQSRKLNEYLKYYPEHRLPFNTSRDKIHKLSNDLYTTYKNKHIYKTIEDIPYHLKPFVYEIHGTYLRTKQPTTWYDIKDYIHNLPPKKLMFSLNYME